MSASGPSLTERSAWRALAAQKFHHFGGLFFADECALDAPRLRHIAHQK